MSILCCQKAFQIIKNLQHIFLTRTMLKKTADLVMRCDVSILIDHHIADVYDDGDDDDILLIMMMMMMMVTA